MCFGFDCVREFSEYIYTDIAQRAANIKSSVYVFAHNFRGYDGHFIIDDVFKRNFTQKNVVMAGTKKLNLVISNVHFIDTLSYFQQPLSSLPKSFGFDDIIEKGFFPHKMNTPYNMGYEDVVPPIEAFGSEHMKESTLEELKKWRIEYQNYLTSNGLKYKLCEELVNYCQSDVNVLLYSVMDFRKLFENVTELDPITRCFTLASIGLEYFRAKVLQEDTLGVTPINGYINLRNKSKKADVWLDLKGIELHTEILREYKLGRFYADGYIPETKTVFEFWGCYWHSCPICQLPNNPEKTERVSYEKTVEKV